jgi:phosphoglycolate phosphatase
MRYGGNNDRGVRQEKPFGDGWSTASKNSLTAPADDGIGAALWQPDLPDLIVWDIDRTLLDAGPATHDAFQAAVRTVWPAAGVTSGHRMTGRTDPTVAREALLAGGIEPDRADQLVREVLRVLHSQYAERVDRFRAEGCVLPGVPELLDVLNRLGVMQTVLTGSIRSTALFKLELFGLADALDTEVGAFGDDFERREDLLSVLMRRGHEHRGRRVTPHRLWVVGDTPGDLACARQLGARCLLVATGLYSRHELTPLKPDGVVDDLGDWRHVLDIFRGAPANHAGEQGIASESGR